MPSEKVKGNFDHVFDAGKGYQSLHKNSLIKLYNFERSFEGKVHVIIYQMRRKTE